METLSKYYKLASYAAGKTPAVLGSSARFLTFGANVGQEESDVRTVATVSLLKALSQDADKATLETVQALTGRIIAPPETIWGIQSKFELSNFGEIESFIDEAIRKTKPADIDEAALPKSRCVACSGEWERPRKYKGPINNLSPREQFRLMQDECTDKETVILYFHGGAHFLGNETGHRTLVSDMAGRAGIKGFSVRYRLSPQNPFPSAITDALASYEYLTNPPSSALHGPIDPSRIIVAGDSAGGNIAAALLITLLESQQRWKLPGGVILLSPWVDLTHSLPSCAENGENDYIAELIGDIKTFRKSKAWDGHGKQRQMYCQDIMVTHPLVSPMSYDHWKPSTSRDVGNGVPGVIVQVGAEERLRDEARYLAQYMSKCGVPVQFDEYLSMPHVFQMVSTRATASLTSMKEIERFIVSCANGETQHPRNTVRSVKSGTRDVTFEKFDHEDVKRRMVESRDAWRRMPYKSVL